MKKTYILGLMAAVLGFTACSSNDDAVLPENKHEGMVLKASVEQAIETRATIDNATGTWTFDFSQGDEIWVKNDISKYAYSTFTKGANDFTSTNARPSDTPASWFAYFPNAQIELREQTGRIEDVANKYALSGATSEVTTGEFGLTIAMQPNVAILVIDNQKGAIDINVKNGPNSWVALLRANVDSEGFEILTSGTKQTILTTDATGTYYIAVPAGVQLSIKDGDRVIKSTGVNGLTAGKYYNLAVFP